MTVRERFIAGFCVAIGLAIGYTATAIRHANMVEIHKTNIGGFILQNGKIYSIHEMWKEQIEGGQ